MYECKDCYVLFNVVHCTNTLCPNYRKPSADSSDEVLDPAAWLQRTIATRLSTLPEKVRLAGQVELAETNFTKAELVCMRTYFKRWKEDGMPRCRTRINIGWYCSLSLGHATNGIHIGWDGVHYSAMRLLCKPTKL